MHTRCFAEIGKPFEEVEARFLDAPGEWMPDVEPQEGVDVRYLVVRLEPGLRVPLLGKNVRVAFGRPVREATKTSLPVSWSATGPSGLFPTLWGTLEIARQAPDRTLVALLVQYAPPFGELGQALDRTVLRGVAEKTLRAFLGRVSEALQEAVG